jgi:NADH:ubiquinone oxidoreductase subunit K
MSLDIIIVNNFLLNYLFFKEILIYLFLLINIGFLNLIFNYNNFIILLISFEMILFNIGLLFIIFSINFGGFEGYIYALILIVIASCESVIGFSLLVRFYKLKGSIKKINFFFKS